MNYPVVRMIWPQRFFVLILFLFLSVGKMDAQSALNMTQLANWDNNSLPSIGNATFNDVWGYAANGREYAILGTVQGFYIIDVTLPSSPSVVTFHTSSSSNSFWRDFKTYQNYLYTVSDQGASSELEIFDLSGLPTSITRVYNSQAFFSTCHNIQIDQGSGHLYAAGTTSSPNGVIILDLSTTPANPTLLANFSLGAYVHDVYVHNDTCVAFFGNTGVGMFDFANLAMPGSIGLLLAYPDPGYAHSGWADEEFETLYWTTETQGTNVKISDFSSGFNLDVVGNLKSALLAPAFTNSTAHNPFVKGDYLYIAYYEDGVKVYDISNRTAPVVAGYFDTHSQNTDYGTSYEGCWGVYPYLPSGNILASDQANGLFVLGQNTSFPVILTNYRIENLDDQVRILWTTTREVNHDRFVLERSQDGENFEAFRTIPGQGDTEAPRDYEVNDFEPLEGRSYYRLTQIDQDGTTTYSEVLTVRRGKSFHFIGVVPNPAVAGRDTGIEFDLEKSSKVDVLVTDLVGHIVHHQIQDYAEGYQRHIINTNNWTAGAYLVRVTANGKSFTSKLLLNQ